MMCLTEENCVECNLPTSNVNDTFYERRRSQRRAVYSTVLNLDLYSVTPLNTGMTHMAGQLQLCPLNETPLYPCFADQYARLQSFIDNDWPGVVKDYAESLASWGYFYLGKSTRVV